MLTERDPALDAYLLERSPRKHAAIAARLKFYGFLPLWAQAREALAERLLPATNPAPLDLTTPAWAHYFAGVDATFTQGESRARRRPRMPA